MSQQQKEEAIAKFDKWLSSQTEDDLVKLIYRDIGLNQTKIAKLAGIGESSVKKNPYMVEQREMIEDRFREKGLLPPKKEKGNDPKKHCSLASKSASEKEKDIKIAELEKRCKALEAQQEVLQSQLKDATQIANRHQEVFEVICELGIIK